MPCNKENNFIPQIISKIPDIIYLCYPNNPTGTVISKEELKKWVDYAKENVVAITDPVYPVYLDTNIIAGRNILKEEIKSNSSKLKQNKIKKEEHIAFELQEGAEKNKLSCLLYTSRCVSETGI